MQTEPNFPGCRINIAYHEKQYQNGSYHLFRISGSPAPVGAGALPGNPAVGDPTHGAQRTDGPRNEGRIERVHGKCQLSGTEGLPGRCGPEHRDNRIDRTRRRIRCACDAAGRRPVRRVAGRTRHHRCGAEIPHAQRTPPHPARRCQTGHETDPGTRPGMANRYRPNRRDGFFGRRTPCRYAADPL